MNDKLLEEFFNPRRWEEAIESGYAKGIRQSTLKAMCNPQVRMQILKAFITDTICVAPPHEAQIPKDDLTMRTVYANEEMDRILLAIANNLLMDMCPEFIHPTCKSYQRGIGNGKVVIGVSKEITAHSGWKTDISKYFDSVPIKYIDMVFDAVERKYGKSLVINWLRRYYHSNYVVDLEKKMILKYTSLKQGCAVASFLANAVLYHIDAALSAMNGSYYRYSDDMIFIGPDADKALDTLKNELAAMQMRLNPKKVEAISGDHWFTFLGFSIKGRQISFSKKSIKNFQSEIEKRTIKNINATYKSALNDVMRYLYIGNGSYSWATSKLTIVNVEHDVLALDNYVKDALRAVMTNKRKIGGIGYVTNRNNGVVDRGRGKNVKNNRLVTPKELDNYKTIPQMRSAIVTDRAAYDTLVRMM